MLATTSSLEQGHMSEALRYIPEEGYHHAVDPQPLIYLANPQGAGSLHSYDELVADIHTLPASGNPDLDRDIIERPIFRVLRYEDEAPQERHFDQPHDESDGRIISTASPEDRPKGQSIFESYDAGNEVRFLGKHLDEGAPRARLERYTQENILKFVSEFAAKVPSQRLPGTITTEGNLDIAGFDMNQMTAETAEMAEAGPRERAEYVGLTRATKLLQNAIKAAIANGESSENIRVAWDSPRKQDSNYSILFYFEVGAYDEAMQGYPVTERILRYDEEFGDLRKSRRIYTELQTLANQPWTGHQLKTDIDFLHSPILLRGDEVTDQYVMEKICAISRDEIEFTREFEGRVSEDLKTFIHAYISLAFSIAEGTTPVSSKNLKILEDHLGRIYFWSKEIAKLMRSKESALSHVGMYVDVNDPRANERFQEARDRGELITEDGTSCPTVKSGSIYSMAEKQTKLCCKCPLCGEEVVATIANGSIRCPSCKRQRRVPKKQPRREETVFRAVEIETQVAPANLSIFSNSNQSIAQDTDYMLAA